MIKAVALDGEPPAVDVIQAFCDMTEDIELVKTFAGADEAASYLRRTGISRF